MLLPRWVRWVSKGWEQDANCVTFPDGGLTRLARAEALSHILVLEALHNSSMKVAHCEQHVSFVRFVRAIRSCELFLLPHLHFHSVQSFTQRVDQGLISCGGVASEGEHMCLAEPSILRPLVLDKPAGKDVT